MHSSTSGVAGFAGESKGAIRGEPLLKPPALPAPKTIRPTSRINAASRIVEVQDYCVLGDDLPPGAIEMSMSRPSYYRPLSEPIARVGRHRLYGDTYHGCIRFGEEIVGLDEVEHFVTALLEVTTRTRLAKLCQRIELPGRDLATGGYDWDKWGRDMRALRELENADRDLGDEQPEGHA